MLRPDTGGCATRYLDEVSDVTLLNWPQVDYWLAPLIGVAETERSVALTQTRQLTLCFVHWLQTDAPRPDGGTGYPGLRLCPDVLGTQDGLAATAYVRESRRIVAEFTVLETHVGVEARPGADQAEAFSDSVGVGCYRIDLHPSAAGRGYLDIATYPFQIPLGALIPPAIGQSPGRRQVFGRHARHKWLLSTPPGGMERRRGCWRPCRLLPRPKSEPASGAQLPAVLADVR